MCAQIEKDYDNFTANNHSFTHIKVDCDATPKVKFFFDARIDPQFIMLINGAEVRRQVGYNFNLMEDHLEQIREFHFKDANYIGDSGTTWERFYDAFDRYAKDGEADRDSFRMQMPYQTD